MFQKALLLIQTCACKSFACNASRNSVCRKLNRSFSWAPAKLCALQVNGWTKTLRLSPSFKVLRHSYCSNEAPLTACDDEREKCDDEREKSLAIAKLFYEACKLEGVMEIPNRLSDEQWQELSSRKTITSSRKYLKYLFLNEMRKNKLKEKRIKKRDISDKQQRKIVTEKHISAEEKQLVYGLWHNCFLNKVTSRRIRAASDEKLMRAKLFGQPIVFDGTFASHMSGKEAKNAANQFNLGYRINKSNRDPYDIYLCNFNLDDDFNKPLLKIVPKIMDERFPAEVLKDNYLKIFDKERLVYLSPHADGDLEEYDHDAVYIIGYLVDLGYNEPLSLAKAKQEGIKMKKFPLEKYLNWGCGDKRLPLDQVLGIMLEFKNTGSWVKAFNKYIPKRKLKQPTEKKT